MPTALDSGKRVPTRKQLVSVVKRLLNSLKPESFLSGQSRRKL
jgi:hypothetical protein